VTEEEKKEEKGTANVPVWSALQVAWVLGYTIAIPIVLFAFAGRWLDAKFETSPWLLLAGVILSIFISSALVYHKVKKLI
jgi:membrane protein YdbS with pleckstrin-like domain